MKLTLAYLKAWAVTRRHQHIWRFAYQCGGYRYRRCLSCGIVTSPDVAT